MKKAERKPWKGSKHEQYDLAIPVQFRMVCLLLEVDPEEVLHDFMNTLGMESYSKGREAEATAERYFLQCGYGQDYYVPEDIQQMFYELRAISTLWPESATPALLDRHAAWRAQYYEYWYKKWRNKVRRKDGGVIPEQLPKSEP